MTWESGEVPEASLRFLHWFLMETALGVLTMNPRLAFCIGNLLLPCILLAAPAKGKPSTELPSTVTEELGVVYAVYGERQMEMDLFTPAEKAEEAWPAIVVVHGGGWLKGDRTKFRALAIALAEKGYVTAAISYRLGGEAHFPAAIHDCNAATRYLRANADKLHIDPERIGAVGGSAGGHLVGLMATGAGIEALQGEGGNSGVSSALQMAVVMAGPLQMTTGSVAERSRTAPEKSNSNQWLGKTIDEAPELYALADAHLHVSKDTPPMLFLCGELDKPERNEATREKLRELEIPTKLVVFPGAKHGAWNNHPWFKEFVQEIDIFAKEHL